MLERMHPRTLSRHANVIIELTKGVNKHDIQLYGVRAIDKIRQDYIDNVAYAKMIDDIISKKQSKIIHVFKRTDAIRRGSIIYERYLRMVKRSGGKRVNLKQLYRMMDCDDFSYRTVCRVISVAQNNEKYLNKLLCYIQENTETK